MDANQENKVSMYNKVDTFFFENIGAYSGYVTLASLVGLYRSMKNSLYAYDAVATGDTTGYRDQKDYHRTEARRYCLAASGAIMALGSATNNLVLRNKGNITETELKRLRDTEEYIAIKSILDLVLENDAALSDYNIDATFIGDFSAKVNAYMASLEITGEQKAVKVAAGQGVDRMIAEIDELLQNSIDPIMKASSITLVDLYNQYKNVRKIDDYSGGGGTPPDVVLTIPPTTIMEALTTAYLPSRSFKIKNNGSDTLNWGLSNNNLTFSNPPHQVNAGDISTKLSSTLAPDGDYLLVENTSANTAVVEITVLE